MAKRRKPTNAAEIARAYDLLVEAATKAANEEVERLEESIRAKTAAARRAREAVAQSGKTPATK